MNYELLFKLELEKNRQMQSHLDFYTNEYEVLKLRLKHLKKENELLKSNKARNIGEFEPKLQQRIITEIYI